MVPEAEQPDPLLVVFEVRTPRSPGSSMRPPEPVHTSCTCLCRRSWLHLPVLRGHGRDGTVATERMQEQDRKMCDAWMC